jgi:hypothetical protein
MVLFLGYGLVQPLRLKTTTLEIKNGDIPEAFVGKKLLFLSDIHFGHFLSKERLEAIITKANSLGPDAIFLGGDYIESNPADYATAFSKLGKLSAPLGVYGVLGNHDYRQAREHTLAQMEAANIKSLNNSALWIPSGNDRIKVGGVGDLWMDEQTLTRTTDDTTEQDFVILLSHNPDYVREVNSSKIDLALSGHTHAGQITLFGLWAPWVPSRYGQELRYGLKEVGKTALYITSGVGTTFLPLRFFTRPEMVVITLSH